MERRRIVHVDDFADRTQPVDGLGADLGHRIAPVLIDQEQRHGSRLLEHVTKLPQPGRPGFAVTSTSPARAQAYSIRTHSGLLGDQTTTRSAGRNREANASANRSLSASSAA